MLDHGEALQHDYTTSFELVLNPKNLALLVPITVGRYAKAPLLLLSTRCVARALRQPGADGPSDEATPGAGWRAGGAAVV